MNARLDLDLRQVGCSPGVASTSDAIREDARHAYSKTCNQVLRLTIKGFEQGKIVFNPTFQRFLVKKGFTPGPKPT